MASVNRLEASRAAFGFLLGPFPSGITESNISESVKQASGAWLEALLREPPARQQKV